jgi:energy-coupling factor transporter ATP-binding protein EcfA2
MIRRLHVDNFRSLADFTWEPGCESLVVGYNGSGKTTALDAVDVIRKWAHGWDRLENYLSADQLTRWSDSEGVLFELDVEAPEGLFRYRVEFEFGRRRGVPQVRREALRIGPRTVFIRTKEAISVRNGRSKPTAHYPLPRNQSAVTALSASADPELSVAFLNALSRMIVVRPMPPTMDNEAGSPQQQPSHRFENFVGWYWNNAVRGKFPNAFLGLLNDVWPEFENLNLEQLGRKFSLSVVFKEPRAPAGEFKLDFTELSDGERMLIVLYTLLAYQRATPATTIIIDEPDNFVALAELQPWLLKMLDERPDGGQIIIVSHNSEIIQTMGYESAAFFHRADHLSKTLVRPVDPDDTGLSLDERLRRGWLDG